eukprot:TRINITY_DN2950_c0_g2_i2.p1 TRINITY_DN2950_c0_g2~~TRINITY_DN2950_c0_g2_i2.p1  ORF type:complete len:658 (+),score=165.38 TRINITY_DN2950_c0_g2_i2:1023-2996(+)
MRRMLVAIDHMDCMELVESRRALAAVDAGSWVVIEVSAVARALRSAVYSLQEYKEFLPGSCFADDHHEMDGPQTSVRPPEQGDVCIAFTDIQSSTVLWEWSPQVMHDALRQHNRVIRSTAAGHNGYEVKVIGDAFMLAFPTAVDGVAFALEAQRALLHADWPPELLQCELCSRQPGPDGKLLWCGVRIRIGLNYGPVLVETNPVTRRQDYFGPTVNVAARVESAVKYGGLVGVTDGVIQACGAQTLKDLGGPAIFPLRAIQLKGVRDPVAISVVLPTGLAARKGQCDTAAAARSDSRLPLVRRPSGSSTNPVAVSPSSRRNRSQTPDVRSAISRGSLSPANSSSSLTRAGSGSASSSVSNRVARARKLSLRMNAVGGSVACVRCALLDASPVDARLPQLLQQVEHNAEFMRGVVISVCSAATVVTWNVAATCADHRAQAFHFVSALAKSGAQARHGGAAPRHVGAAAGPVLAGNVQAGRRRYPVTIGGCVEFASLLAAEAEQDHSSALLTSAVADYGAATGSVTKAQLWCSRELPESGITVWEFLVGTGGEDHEEEASGEASSRWGAVLHSDITVLDQIVPPDTFMRAAKGEEDAIGSLRELATVAPSDARVAALLSRLDRGALGVRNVPPSAFFMGSCADASPTARGVVRRHSAFL